MNVEDHGLANAQLNTLRHGFVEPFGLDLNPVQPWRQQWYLIASLGSCDYLLCDSAINAGHDHCGAWNDGRSGIEDGAFDGRSRSINLGHCQAGKENDEHQNGDDQEFVTHNDPLPRCQNAGIELRGVTKNPTGALPGAPALSAVCPLPSDFGMGPRLPSLQSVVVQLARERPVLFAEDTDILNGMCGFSRYRAESSWAKSPKQSRRD